VLKLREQFQTEMTYNSNAIEGNTLTLRETYLVMQEGLTIKGKPLKDHVEAKDHRDALDFLYGAVAHKSPPLSAPFIRRLHLFLMRGTDATWAGKYRDGAVSITGASPDAEMVTQQVANLIRWLRRGQRRLHPVVLAALFHHKLASIHPFFDGNGRTARLCMNVILMRRGFPLAIILRNDRTKYYYALQEADAGRPSLLILFVAQAVERSLDLYLRTFEHAPTAHLLTLTQASRGSPYSPKYLNLLARTGRLSAFKQGRVWHTTKQAIADYRKSRLRNRK
jgi:Fic family protein